METSASHYFARSMTNIECYSKFCVSGVYKKTCNFFRIYMYCYTQNMYLVKDKLLYKNKVYLVKNKNYIVI